MVLSALVNSKLHFIVLPSREYLLGCVAAAEPNRVIEKQKLVQVSSPGHNAATGHPMYTTYSLELDCAHLLPSPSLETLRQ